jgi:hypothetical protein
MISILSGGGVRRSSAPGSACQRNSLSAEALILEAVSKTSGRAIFFKAILPAQLPRAISRTQQANRPTGGMLGARGRVVAASRFRGFENSSRIPQLAP